MVYLNRNVRARYPFAGAVYDGLGLNACSES